MSADASPKSLSQLQYVPFTSYIEMGFFHKLTQNKLDVYGLNEQPVNIHGFYGNGDAAGLPARMSLDHAAFNENENCPARTFPALGLLYNKNTIASFKDCDKKLLIDSMGKELWENLKSGQVLENPGLLNRFLLLTFADIKKYHYYYWFAFPALRYPAETSLLNEPCRLDQSHLKEKVCQLQEEFDRFEDSAGKAFFLVHLSDSSDISIHSIRDFPSLHSGDGKIIIAMSDPSTMDSNPGWPLRNLLAVAAYHWLNLTEEFEVLCLRERVKEGKRIVGHSLLFSVKLTKTDGDSDVPNIVGWEKNDHQKLGPRLMNLSSSMDPNKLAESSVDLNLKLMKWRVVPSLDLDKITRTRCLLLGSGTLGCNVARLLLGWGVRKITMVDNSCVSYSNPVRQTLFKFADCLDGGKPKAEAASASLKMIFPGVDSIGVDLSIPMPGHSVSESDIPKVLRDVEILEHLIDEHDVVFLLMDTRESRWLPTVVAAAKQKLVINAALGFDTFLVLRHGLKASDCCGDGSSGNLSGGDCLSQSAIPGSMLGCYFCSDVVAPGNSTRDRTLDQQCTVSRPGLSMLAAAFAVELLMSVIQHPLGGYAEATTTGNDDHLSSEQPTVLGDVPHQIRGFLSRFYHVMPCSMLFDKCTACSYTVLKAYNENGFNFLLKAFNSPSYLEDLTGLTELHNESENAEVWELSDDEAA